MTRPSDQIGSQIGRDSRLTPRTGRPNGKRNGVESRDPSGRSVFEFFILDLITNLHVIQKCTDHRCVQHAHERQY